MTALTQKASGRAALTAGIIGAVVLLLALVLVSTATAIEPEGVRVKADQACASEGYGDSGEQFIIPRSGLSVYEETITLDSGVTVDLFSPPNRSFVDFTVTGALVEGGFIFNRVNSNQANFYDYRPGGTDKGSLEPPPRDNGNDKLVVLCFGLRTEVSIDKVTLHGDGEQADSTSDYIAEGAPITWKYTVSIPGTEPAEALENVVVTDDDVTVPSTPTSGDTGNDGILEPGETWIYLVDGTATAGAYTNTGSVSADGVGSGRTATDSDDSGYFGVRLGLTVDATTRGFATGDTVPYVDGDGVFIETGDTVEWQYVVMNTSNLPVTGLMVSDLNADITGISCSSTSLAAGESTTCSATGTAEYSDIGVFFENEGTATATSDAGAVPAASDTSSYFGYEATFEVQVELIFAGESYDPTTTPLPVILAGEPITWRFTVENTGNVPVTTTIVAEINGETETVVCDEDDLGDIPPGEVEGNPATCDYGTTADDAETTTSFEVVGEGPNETEVSETIANVGYYGGLDCGDTVRYEGPALINDGPDVGFVVGPVSSDQPCGTAVQITAQIDATTQSTTIAAPPGYDFIGTGIATIAWDAVPRDDDPIVRTVQGIGGAGAVIEYCAAVVDVTQPGGVGDFELIDPAALYPTATDFDGNGTIDGDVCLIRQFNNTVDIGSGVVYTQLIEVFYIWNDPNFSRPR